MRALGCDVLLECHGEFLVVRNPRRGAQDTIDGRRDPEDLQVCGSHCVWFRLVCGPLTGSAHVFSLREDVKAKMLSHIRNV